MRRKRTTANLELYAVSGTNCIVLSLDMKTKPDGLRGFAFERVETKKRIWLYGQKFLHSVIHEIEKEGSKFIEAVSTGRPHIVLLGMDLLETKCPGLLGFALRREDHTDREKYWLSGYKNFASVPGTIFLERHSANAYKLL